MTELILLSITTLDGTSYRIGNMMTADGMYTYKIDKIIEQE